jgi:hypothetical protein
MDRGNLAKRYRLANVAFNLGSSQGIKSGKYAGKNINIAPVALIALIAS